MMPVHVTRAYRFSSGHRLHRPDRSEPWNRAVYGKCSLPGGHGHNYRLEVTVTGRPDPETGWVLAPRILDRIVEAHVLDALDHRNLNEVISVKEGPCPTTEVLLVEIRRRLEKAIPSPLRLSRLRLEETAKNSFELRLGPAPLAGRARRGGS